MYIVCPEIIRTDFLNIERIVRTDQFRLQVVVMGGGRGSDWHGNQQLLALKNISTGASRSRQVLNGKYYASAPPLEGV